MRHRSTAAASAIPPWGMLLTCASIVLAVVALGPAAWAQDVVVTTDGLSATRVIVDVGESVNFVNDGEEPVRFGDTAGTWDSGELAPGEVFSISFDEPGTIAFASEDGSLTGRIIVGGVAPVRPEGMPNTGSPALLLLSVALASVAAGTLLLRRARHHGL